MFQGENILLAHNEEGYNLLQKCVGLNNVDMVRWILTRNIDINRGACSLPLHIACLKGYVDLPFSSFFFLFFKFWLYHLHQI